MNVAALPVAPMTTDAMPGGLLDAIECAIQTRGLRLHYGDVPALDGVDLDVPRHRVTALIGPSGCGKSSLLRCFNRLNDEIAECRVEGQVRVLDVDAYAPDVVLPDLRRRVGMVFQRPNPFPMPVLENVAFGLRLAGIRSRSEIEARVEAALRAAALWEEVRDRLERSALELSAGQQQRLVIARAIAVEPEVLLMDEPASMLDPISTLKFEELLVTLRAHYTVLLVTHNMQQAARVADYTAYMHGGRILEFDATERLFTNPRLRQTEDYITGKFLA
ncbi:phosphate ABC transporter ATP-binding protein PstB [Tahibacter amnicola]|uniref:Phosphate ABC transporter ATP-binding protein PstB n=1 Tax=Tahibacter amnicola TaxID=2976241 RepID=A0ABY6BHU5_9GAMM|nr:phosphate ABC transporter ATP-binding protein PstB [Tahibacter amnicola]UXI69574.1 phosphate ABC transporter ATP-binding protein PstB [Tahibacter amnicola]